MESDNSRKSLYLHCYRAGKIRLEFPPDEGRYLRI
nr:MAG TPA: hypothetical protein [Caudoviricetes sp.]DAL60159.1 MAG TPA_asm: hypothetical protein [Caudoviricetes sp.]DAT52144.1 MAG TPA: hypothetical protein [Caudoviricetes sp.]